MAYPVVAFAPIFLLIMFTFWAIAISWAIRNGPYRYFVYNE